MATSKYPEDDDPVLAAEMARALKPYEGLVTPAMMEVLRDNLRHALTEHEVGKVLLDRVRAMERRAPLHSGQETKEDVALERPASTPSSGGKPGRR